MNAVEIEQAISEMALQPFDAAEFLLPSRPPSATRTQAPAYGQQQCLGRSWQRAAAQHVFAHRERRHQPRILEMAPSVFVDSPATKHPPIEGKPEFDPNLFFDSATYVPDSTTSSPKSDRPRHTYVFIRDASKTNEPTAERKQFGIKKNRGRRNNGIGETSATMK